MKNLKSLSLLATLAFTCASAQAQSDAAAAIKAYYAKEDALTLKVDITGLKKLHQAILTDDFVSTQRADKTGKVRKKTKAEEISEIDRLGQVIASVTSSVTHVDHVTGGQALVQAMITSSGSLKTKPLGDGKAHTLTNTSKSQDTWIKVKGVWKMKASKSLSDNLKVDGQPVPGM